MFIYRILMLFLAPTAHEMPHKCLKANYLLWRAECITEGLIQGHIARGYGRVPYAEDFKDSRANQLSERKTQGIKRT